MAIPRYIYFICPWVEWRSGLAESEMLICEHTPSFITYDYELANKLYTDLNEKYPPQSSGSSTIKLPNDHTCMFFGDKKGPPHNRIYEHGYYYTVVKYSKKRKIYVNVSSCNESKLFNKIPEQKSFGESSLLDLCLRIVVQKDLPIKKLPLDLVERVEKERESKKDWFIYFNSSIYETIVHFFAIPHSGDDSEQKMNKLAHGSPEKYFTGDSLTENVKCVEISFKNPIIVNE
uniref:Uncharacterized protein n=1 Tax=Marseillevirus LCMAC102 TaxID=2506603 RepID=A0A481YU57_9VIRU|nr:MAG: hypothetical protein LCMAC102_02160 [Marseillevirus LCMAC102]